MDRIEKLEAQIEELQEELASLDQFASPNVEGMTDLNADRAEKLQDRIRRLQEQKGRLESERGF